MNSNKTRTNPLSRSLLIATLIPVVSMAVASASAATRRWDGGGADAFWTTAANWVGDVAPVAGDDLVFPLSPRPSNTNDFPAGTSFSGISFGGFGFTLRGSPVTLTGGIVLSNTSTGNTIEFSILLSGSQTFVVSNFTASLNLGAPGSGTVIDTTGGNLNLAGSGSHWVRAQIVGNGGLSKIGSGGVLLFTSNAFTGPFNLQEGNVGIFDPNALGSTNSGTTIGAGAQLDMATAMTVAEPLTLFGVLGSTAGSTTNTGPIELVGPAAGIRTQSGLTINSIISGAGGFTKTDLAFLVLNSNNTYQGATVVSNGTLRVNGSQPQSTMMLPKHGTILAGSGVVGDVVFSSVSTIGPSSPSGTIGILTCSNLTLAGGATYGAELSSAAPGTGYDQLNVLGAVTLNNCGLNVSLGFPANMGTEFIIINNDGNDAVQGTFQNLPQGTVFTASGAVLQISYVGGDGNDVVLTRVDSPQKLAAITPSLGGLMQIEGAGLSNVVYRIQAATNLSPSVQWSDVGAATGNLSGAFWFTDTNAPIFPMRFYRALFP